VNPVLRWQTPLPELVGVFIANDRHQLKIAKCTVDKLNAIDTSKYTTTPTHTHTRACTHTSFNGPLSGTTQVNWYQKGKTNLDFTEATENEWQ